MWLHRCVLSLLAAYIFVVAMCATNTTMLFPSPSSPTLCVFTTVAKGSGDARVERVLREWSRLLNGFIGELVLIVTGGGDAQPSHPLGYETLRVDATWTGLPRVDAMMDAAHAWARRRGARVAVMVNSDVMPSARARDALRWLSVPEERPHGAVFGTYKPRGRATKEWFAVAARFDVYHNETVQTLHRMGGYDLWAWSTSSDLGLAIPPFRMGRSMYDNWLLDELLRRGTRHVVDLTPCAPLWHTAHRRLFGTSGDWFHAVKTSGNADAYVNRHLAFANGYTTSLGTWCEPPWTCRVEEGKSTFALHRRVTRSNVMCTPRSAHFPECDVDADSSDCIAEIARRTDASRAMTEFLPDASKRSGQSALYRATHRTWPHTLERQVHARRDPKANVVVLTAFNRGYLPFAINVHCAMDRLGVRHLTMGALDRMAYAVGVSYGLPVFDAYSHLSVHGTAAEEVLYGTRAFRSLTKAKSALVLAVLRLGVSVVFTDVDVGWTVDPLKALTFSLAARDVLHIQSNAPYVDGGTERTAPNGAVVAHEGDPLGVERLNSGLYVAPHSPRMEEAFVHIVRRALASPLSEQPAFFHALCSHERNATAGTCTGGVVDVRTLDRLEFRHGAVFAPVDKPATAYHANWRQGSEAKRAALTERGMWWVRDGMFCVR